MAKEGKLFLVAFVEAFGHFGSDIQRLVGIDGSGFVENHLEVFHLVVFGKEVVETVLKGLVELALELDHFLLGIGAVLGISLLLLLVFLQLGLILLLRVDLSVLRALLDALLEIGQGIFFLCDAFWNSSIFCSSRALPSI